MARNEIDLIDVGALTLAPIAAAMVLGVFALTVEVFGVGSLSTPIFATGGAEITIPLLIYVGSVVWIVATNEIDGSDYEDWEYGVIAFSVLAIPLFAFVPAFQALVTFSDVGRVVLTLLVSGSAVLVSFRS